MDIACRERAVKRQCHDTARLYGFDDRGVLAPGFLADLNVIDLGALALHLPTVAFDLPAGGRRLPPATITRSSPGR